MRCGTRRLAGIAAHMDEAGHHILGDPDPGSATVYARAESTLVAFDMTAQRPRRLDEDERAALTAYLGAPAEMRRRR